MKKAYNILRARINATTKKNSFYETDKWAFIS